jgi:GDP-4-dehydro-6-deoxy-D-mannose reductase
MRILVTGASGFAGTHLCRRLRDDGHQVIALASQGETDFQVDVGDRAALIGAVEEAAPHGIFHLAGVAFVPAADAAADEADRVNHGGTVNVLDAAQAVGARTIVVSSGAVYGRLAHSELPATESSPLRPVGAYARSKAAAEEACRARAGQQPVIVMRPFNHTGPGQSREYVCSDFAAQVAECEAGLRPARLEVGDLAAERDFSDVRDVADAYVAAYERAAAGETYNVCSGRATPVATVLDILVSLARIKVDVDVRTERLRPGEVSRAYGSYAKLERAVGWRPRRALETTLADLLEDWRGRLRSGASR